jgi:hypothetical protein
MKISTWENMMSIRKSVIIALFQVIYIPSVLSEILMDGPNELEPDISSYSNEPRTYAEGDVVIRFRVLGPRLVDVDLPNIDIQGYTLPAESRRSLRHSVLLDSKFNWGRPFGPTAWKAVPVVPTEVIFCSPSRQPVGPFKDTPARWGVFKAKVCLLDSSGSGKFDAILLIGKDDARIIGPVPIEGVIYTPQGPENERGELMELYVEEVYDHRIIIGTENYRDGKKYHPKNIFLETPDGLMVNYVMIHGIKSCTIVLRKERTDHVVEIARSDFIIKDVDAKSNRFVGNFASQPPTIRSFIREYSDWVPSLATGCRFEE